jgi:Repeat of unknown function (DUF346)
MPSHITLLARGVTGELFHKEWDGVVWSGCHSLGVPIARGNGSQAPVPVDWQLAACSGEPGRVDLFARSPEGDLLQMTQIDGKWGTFEYLGTPASMGAGTPVPMGLGSSPAACGWGPDRLDVFAVGPDGDLLHTAWNGQDWSEFASLGAPAIGAAGIQQQVPLSGSVAACRCGRDRIAVFLRGARGDLIVKWWDGTGWGEYISLGFPEVQSDLYPAVNIAAPLAGPPAACSWGLQRADVFARGPHGDLLHRWWDGKGWTPFESLGVPVSPDPYPHRIPFTGAVTACTWGPNRLDVFARALDGNLYHAWWDGGWDHD